MAGGTRPGPIDDLGPPVVIDKGTLAPTESPTPGPIGVQANGGSGTTSATVLGDKVVAFAREKLGQSVGTGECFDLADQALRSAGAKSAADFGTVTPNADYVWGTVVGLSEVHAGDIIQFKNYRYDRTVETGSRTDTDFQERPHHTAIVERVEGQGAITVLEQNVPDGSSGQRSQLFFSAVNTNSNGRRTTISVRGHFRFYRPQPR